MPKNTTCRSGFSLAMVSASSGEYTTRTSPPSLLIRNRSFSLPGTRSMSPNEQKITSGRAAISSALSMISSGVTQTGQPGPWIISISSGSSWSMPCRMIEWVCPPQTSMIAQRRRGGCVDLVDQLAGQVGVAEFVQVLHDVTSVVAVLPGAGTPACFAASSNPSPNSSLEHAEVLELGQRPHRRFLVEPLDARNRRGRRRTRRLPRRGCTPGRRPSGRRRSRPPTSGCRHGPRRSGSFPVPPDTSASSFSSCREFPTNS